MDWFDSVMWKYSKWEGIMEKSCRNDCLACGMRGAFSLCPVFIEEQWVGNAVSDRISPWLLFPSKRWGEGPDSSNALRVEFASSSKFSRVGEEGH